MRCTERTPIDDDAENAEIRPRRRVSTCQFRVIHLEYNAPQSSELSGFAVLPPFRRRRVNCWVLPRCRPLNNTPGISDAAKGRKAEDMCCRPKYARYFRVLPPCRTGKLPSSAFHSFLLSVSVDGRGARH